MNTRYFAQNLGLATAGRDLGQSSITYWSDQFLLDGVSRERNRGLGPVYIDGQDNYLFGVSLGYPDFMAHNLTLQLDYTHQIQVTTPNPRTPHVAQCTCTRENMIHK